MAIDMKCLEQANADTENRLVIAKGWEEWRWGVTTNGQIPSFLR